MYRLSILRPCVGCLSSVYRLSIVRVSVVCRPCVARRCSARAASVAVVVVAAVAACRHDGGPRAVMLALRWAPPPRRAASLLLLVLAAACLAAMQLSRAGPSPPAAAAAAADELQRRPPDCIIIGVRKCGTRALLEFLALHPRVAVTQEEVHFFDRDDAYRRGVAWYVSQMPLASRSQVTIEKTPAYFVTPAAPRRIRRLATNARIVLIVRDPVLRLVSDYAQFCDNRAARNKTCPSFEALNLDAVTGEVRANYRPVHTSVYRRHLPRWLAAFPAARLHIVDGDRLVTRPIDELARVQRFLHLDPLVGARQLFYNRTRGFYCMRNATHTHCLGPTKGRKHPTIAERTLDKLRAYFRPHNLAFFNMTGRVFNWR